MSQDERTIQHAVSRLSLRLRVQTAVRWGAIALLAAVVALVLTAVAYQLWWVPAAWLTWAAYGGAALVGLGILAGLARGYERVALAARLDQANDLKDRLGTALDILERPVSDRTDFEVAQLRDAMTHTRTLEVAPAAPWRFPRELLWVAGCVGLLLGASTLDVQPPQDAHRGVRPVWFGNANQLPLPTPVPPPEPPTPEEEQLKDDIEEQLEDNETESEELTGGDEQAMEVLSKLNRALEDLAKPDDEVDPRELSSQAAELEEDIEQLAGDPHQQAEEQALEDKLKEMAEELEKKADKKLRDPKLEEKVKSLAEDLQNKDYEAAAKKLEELMEMFNKLPKKEQERLAKMFEKLGKKFESQLQKEMEKLKKERSRLKKKEEKNGGLNKRDRSRLNKAEKQLDRLNREQEQQQKDHEKQLDRLSKEMQDLADKMRRQQKNKQQQGAKQDQQKQGPEQKKSRMDKRSAKELSEMLKRMAKRQKQRRAGQKMKMKMADMKELMQRRRKGMKSGRKKLQRLAKGNKKGKGGGQDKPGGMKEGEGQGEKKGLLYRQRKEGRQTWARRRNDGDSGAGRTRDQMLSGKETDIKAKPLEDFVEGKEGKGASTREILYGASKKGTRVKGYGKVHIDYSMRASRQMEDEKVPPGYREYVEEYFRLIRKR